MEQHGDREDYPDWCLIDLDPSEKNTFETVIRAAQVTHEVLTTFGIRVTRKPPVPPAFTFTFRSAPNTRMMSASFLEKPLPRMYTEIIPHLTSIERLTKNRGNKLYIDYLQNRPKATLAAPYSLRPKPGAPVSMPLYWEEVKKGLAIKNFTIKNAMERIKTEGDIFKPVLGKGINLVQVLKKIAVTLFR
jgi:bifunctional non-homologous end joining protein LigD